MTLTDDELRDLLSRARKIIPDDQIIKVHGYANFGTMTPRDVVDSGVLKYAMGYSGGHTQLCILLEHGLIRKPRPGHYAADLTVKGKKYICARYRFADLEALPELAAENARLTAANLTLAADNLRLMNEARAIINGALFLKEDGADALISELSK